MSTKHFLTKATSLRYMDIVYGLVNNLEKTAGKALPTRSLVCTYSELKILHKCIMLAIQYTANGHL